MNSTEELKTFLDSNIKNKKDLNLNLVQKLLNEKRNEQAVLDNKLENLKKETKLTLSNALETVTVNQQQLEKLSISLDQTESQLDQFMTDTTTDTPKGNLLLELAKLESKIKTVNNAKSYIKILLVASELSSQALELVKTEPEKAIQPYTHLVRFEEYIKEQTKEREEYKDLSIHLQKTQKRLWEELNQVLKSNFKNVLDTLSWPTPIKPPYGPQLKSKLKSFEEAFRNLTILQQSYDLNHRSDDISSPIATLVEGLSLRFRFHFETSKPTNRLDKPEWYLTHVKNTISSHIPFLMTTVQPILSSLDPSIVAKDQFIRGLLGDLTRKLRKSMPELLKQPNYLSHTIHEVLKFDQSLQEEFAYDRYSDLSNVILGNPIWFKTWIQAEKTFNQSRYDEIILDNKAFDFYEEQVDPTSIKRTKSAVRLIHLLENVTAAYTIVPNITQKFRFLTEIQLNLLDQYHQRVAKAIDSFEALSLIRSVHVPGALPDSVTGVMTSTETGGAVSALHRLYRWWTSARSILDVLKFWSEDEFFLDLQHQITQDPDSVKLILNDILSNQHYDKQSCMIQLNDLEESPLDLLFGNSIIAYQQLMDRIEKIIVRIIFKSWITEARKYSKKDVWWQASTEIAQEISDELYKPLQDLRISFNYLFSVLPQSDFLSIYRKTAKEIEEWYWKNLITQNQFSTLGATQLEFDLTQGLWKIGKRWVMKPENFMKQLKEVILLLNLPLNSEEGNRIGCNLLMKVLADNSQIEFLQKSLDTLGIEVLSNGQIRDVLRRRNDMLVSWN